MPVKLIWYINTLKIILSVGDVLTKCPGVLFFNDIDLFNNARIWLQHIRRKMNCRSLEHYCVNMDAHKPKDEYINMILLIQNVHKKDDRSNCNLDLKDLG